MGIGEIGRKVVVIVFYIFIDLCGQLFLDDFLMLILRLFLFHYNNIVEVTKVTKYLFVGHTCVAIP